MMLQLNNGLRKLRRTRDLAMEYLSRTVETSQCFSLGDVNIVPIPRKENAYI
jgi:hypothetical protein